VSKIIGIREAVKLAEDHAIGILESTDDSAFWGEDFFDEHEQEWDVFIKAKAIIINRIRRNKHA